MRTIANFSREGFITAAIEQPDKSIVIANADGDIDADGANGQNGAKAAYMVDDKGSEYLANGGMGMSHGRVVGVTSWFRSIVILNDDGEPFITMDGVIPSKTAYKWPRPLAVDGSAYVDSEMIPYICVPPEIQNGVAGVVLGCRCSVTYKGGRPIEGMVADIGPRSKIGEISIAMARALGINPDPRKGGEDRPLLTYVIYPGVFSRYRGTLVPLQRKNGTYIIPADEQK